MILMTKFVGRLHRSMFLLQPLVEPTCRDTHSMSYVSASDEVNSGGRYFIASGSSLKAGFAYNRYRWRQVDEETDTPPTCV
jgi:hypothetical protein